MSVFASAGVKPTLPDPNKSSEGNLVYSAAGAAQTWNAITAYDGATVTNCSDCVIRGAFIFDPAVTTSGDQSFLIAPGGSYAVDFQDVDVANDTDAIIGITFDAVDVSALVDGALLASAATQKLGTDWLLVVNAVES